MVDDEETPKKPNGGGGGPGAEAGGGPGGGAEGGPGGEPGDGPVTEITFDEREPEERGQEIVPDPNEVQLIENIHDDFTNDPLGLKDPPVPEVPQGDQLHDDPTFAKHLLDFLRS
jgi:hypothetical protein